jgi:pyrimidine-nucleoside phosphorylase
MLPHELIRKKRDGERLDAGELRAFVAGVTDGTIPDYQAAAMLMAIFFRGLADDELAAWADAMLRSGDVLDLSAIPRVKVDKHSTGGVGDKISLPLAPAVAACGVAVPMVSGRGLGHTGGTLDKLESIPGFQVNLPVERFQAIVAEVGCCLIGQTERIAPADRKLYALRDVTGTVESIPLIASSIMSKKLAEGIDALVLDCKVGSGAFMKSIDRARELARTIQAIGRAAGKKVTAVLSNMDQPIGRAVGNALEVVESIDVLKGGGPADTRGLTVALGAEMLALAGEASVDDGARRIERALDDGTALTTFRRMVTSQGGDLDAVRTAPSRRDVTADRAGFVAAIDAQEIGMAALVLGGGRRKKEDAIDPGVGLLIHGRLGDRVEKGQPLATLVHRDAGVDEAAARAQRAFAVADRAPAAQPLVHEVLR